MYLRPHINPFIYGKTFSRIEKAVNTFSILENFFFPKTNNYYVSLEYGPFKNNAIITSKTLPSKKLFF